MDFFIGIETTDTEFIVAGISLIFTGVLVALLCVPLIKNKIGPNAAYGFRIKKAYESEENWYLINSYGGRLMFYWSILEIIWGIAVFFIPAGMSEDTYFAFIMVPFVLIIPVIMKVYRFANSL